MFVLSITFQVIDMMVHVLGHDLVCLTYKLSRVCHTSYNFVVRYKNIQKGMSSVVAACPVCATTCIFIISHSTDIIFSISLAMIVQMSDIIRKVFAKC